MLYLHVSLSRSSLCRALRPSWTCACVITSIPPRVCLGITTYEIHSYGVGVLDSRLSLPRLMLIRFPCLLCSTHLAFFAFLLLCFFASLHACLHVHLWVCVSSILKSNGSMDIQSKPSFLLLGHPLVGLPTTLLTLAILALSQFKFRCIFEGISELGLCWSWCL